MRTAYRKTFRDLWGNKGRTILVVLSIAVGVMAVGMILSSNTLLRQQMTIAQRASQPSHVVLFLRDLVGEDIMRNVERMPEVVIAQGVADRGVRWKTSLDNEWQDASLVAVDDYKAQKLDLLELRSGIWPDLNSVVVEWNHVEPYDIPEGGTVYFEINERPRPMTVEGTLRDHHAGPPPFTNEPVFYITRDVMERLTGTGDYNKLHFTVHNYSEEEAERVAELVETKLEKQGVTVGLTRIQDPERHWLQDVMDGVGLILQIMAIASLFLSVVLVINTINAIITQQIPQIGIMKAVGGIRGQISRLYLAGIIVYGVLSLLLAVPLGTVAGYALSSWMLRLVNVPVASINLVSNALLVQVGAGLLVPLVAALWPILRGVAISVSEALNAYGLGQGRYGTGLIDRFLGRVHGLPRMTILSIRNTFRRMGRVVLTLVVLTTAGSIFMMVLSTHFSFTSTITGLWDALGLDVFIGFQNAQRIDEVVPLIEARPNVDKVEMWVWWTANTNVPGKSGVGSEYQIGLRGIPRDTEMYIPRLTEGRDLDSVDGHALLLNQKLASEMEVGIGDQIEIGFGEGTPTTWTIVGLVFDLTNNQASAYMHLDTLNRELNQVGRASVAEIRTIDDSLAAQTALVEDLRDYFESLGIDVSFSRTVAEDREQAEAQFTILTTILMLMTVVIAVVGSIGLSGTLSINVIERRREIGVMRAVGASSLDVASIFMGEGLMLGIMSWALAVPVGVLAGRPFVKAIGEVIDFPAQYTLAFQGLWIWLGIVFALSLTASWLPARRATQISVNESLAYE